MVYYFLFGYTLILYIDKMVVGVTVLISVSPAWRACYRIEYSKGGHIAKCPTVVYNPLDWLLTSESRKAFEKSLRGTECREVERYDV